MSMTTDFAWPWSLPTWGTPLLLTVALILVGLTIWTYVGVPGASSRRIAMVLGLRLLALVVALLAVVRPSLAFVENLSTPFHMLIVCDVSESMNIQDEINNQSRFASMKRVLRQCQPMLDQLRDEQNVTVTFYGFAEDVGPFDPEGKAEGKRTDFGQMLNRLFRDRGSDRHLRALLVLSDGADNGTRYSPLAEAEKWRGRSCPICTFSLGLTSTTPSQKDIGFVSIQVEPSPVAVKNLMTVKAVIDAPGFENEEIPVELLIDDKEVAGTSQKVRLVKTVGNEVKFTTPAPANTGEIKVTLRTPVRPGEVNQANNEIATFVNVLQEGLSVLYVDGKPRWEQTFMRDALRADPRIRFVEMNRDSDEPLSVEQKELLQSDKHHFDVIILGDLSAHRLSGGDAKVIQRIHDLVKGGTGFLMMGGLETFANSDWKGTPIADLLPVTLDASGQEDKEVQMVPTQAGLTHFVTQLSEKADPAANKQAWEKLPKLDGITLLGKPKKGAQVLAQDKDTGKPILVYQQYNQGRTLAFAGDTTWRWVNLDLLNSTEGPKLHARFWKQLVLFLAKQEESAGTVWVQPDTRRIPAGSKLDFSVGLRGKNHVNLAGGQFEVTVTGPNQAVSPVPITHEAEGDRGTFVKTDLPGVYTILVKGKGKDIDGKDIVGEAKARFLAYQDTAEQARPAADHGFLAKLAGAAGGKSYRAEELPTFLQQLRSEDMLRPQLKTELYPDWRRSDRTSPFLPGFFVLFVALLGVEWFLRRHWGLV